MKGELKKITDENADLKDQVDKLKHQLTQANENSTMVEIFRQKEEDYEN